MATLQERFDELLALAREAGRLGEQYTSLASAWRFAPRGATAKPRARKDAAKKQWEQAERAYNRAYARFTADADVSRLFASSDAMAYLFEDDKAGR